MSAILDDCEDAQSSGSRGCEEIFKVIICCLPEVEQKMVVPTKSTTRISTAGLAPTTAFPLQHNYHSAFVIEATDVFAFYH